VAGEKSKTNTTRSTATFGAATQLLLFGFELVDRLYRLECQDGAHTGAYRELSALDRILSYVK
jgi:hypothetical protein